MENVLRIFSFFDIIDFLFFVVTHSIICILIHKPKKKLIYFEHCKHCKNKTEYEIKSACFPFPDTV